MTSAELKKLIANGEGLSLEFKRCSGNVESDTFETVCAFLNRFGGTLLLGVEDDGTIRGVSPNGAAAIRNNIVNAANNPARFVIERNRMFTENACRAAQGGIVDPKQLEPDPKNPIIAAFFREVGFADQLGSGVRKLMAYSRQYGGSDPVFEDGDVFRVSVGLPVASADSPIDETVEKTAEKTVEKTKEEAESGSEAKILSLLRKTPAATQKQLMEAAGLTRRGIEWQLNKLKAKGVIRRVGPDKGGHWEVLP